MKPEITDETVQRVRIKTSERGAMESERWVILGSRSPQRRKLLAYLVPEERMIVLPPSKVDERSLASERSLDSIRASLTEIMLVKQAAVHARIVAAIRDREPIDGRVLTAADRWTLVSADTTVVALSPAGVPQCLEQPPETDAWSDTVREWFTQWYSGRSHLVLTAVGVMRSDGQSSTAIARTEVEFHDVTDDLLNWYLATGESRGKAGGYAVQGAGSVFVRAVRGSISNVVGLPLETLRPMLGG